jgi:capsular polysaccharide biosynthesis protein
MQARHTRNSIGLREVLQFWPVIVAVTVIAFGATIWSHGQQVPQYAAMTRLMVVPLAQWDETFLGTSMVRDSGDATRTAATVAAELDSTRASAVTADYLGGNWTAESVDQAVKVTVFESTNVIEIVAISENANDAANLAEGFAAATLADRWNTLRAELDNRIATFDAAKLAAGDDDDANPTAAAELAKLQTLTMIRESGSDPTIRIDSTSAALPMEQLPVWALLGLATAGGLLVGLLSAAGLAMMRRVAVPNEAEVVTSPPAGVYSTNGSVRADADT